MASKIKRLALHLRTFLLLAWPLISGGDGYSCSYGQNCGYDPAPPGRAPPCALPGLTYCIHPEPYPEHVIRTLVEAGQYDVRTLLSDESRDEFNSKRNDYPYGYGPNSLPHVDQISLVDDSLYNKPLYNTKYHTSYNQDVFSQKTPLQPPSAADPTPYNINAYQSANFSKFSGFHGYHTSPGNYWNPQVNQYNPGYEKKFFRQTPVNTGVYNQNFFSTPTFNPNFDSTDWFRQASQGITPYNPAEWWKYVSPSRSDVTVERSITFPTRTSVTRRNSTTTHRGRRRRNAELVKAAAQRKLTGAEALRIAIGLASSETSAERPRRQTSNTDQLCSVRTQFITPRAALNNRGNWKYVVNMPDNMTQLVRAEICTSTQCNGLCSLPIGYSSRCEQKYVQKRLVALESNGQNLYTDIFWIPSCCQCTITPN